MSLEAFRNLKQKRDDLLIVPTDLLVLITPYGNDLPETVIDEAGKPLAMPKGWYSLGEVSKEGGAAITPERSYNEIFGYGSMGARRRIKDSESVNLNFTPQETTKVQLAVQNSVRDTDLANGKGNSGFRVRKYSSDRELYWSMLVMAFDGTADAPIYPWWMFDKVAIGDGVAQNLAMDQPLAGELQFTAYEVSDGGMYDFGIGGKGWVDLSQQAGFAGAASAPVTLTVNGDGGTFTLSFGGQTTDPLNYNTTAATIRTRLEALSTVGTGKVQVSGSAGGPWIVAFDAALQGALSADGTELTGTDTSATVTD